MVSPILIRIGMCAALFCALRLCADVVETKNGARLVGRITSIHGGVVTLETDYAGEIKVKQDLVASITTENPVAVRFADGSAIVGIISAPASDKITVTSPKKSVDSSVTKIAATWAAGQEDPDVVAKRRKWSFAASADINGRSGTHNQLTTAYSYRSKLTGPDDTFQYYTNYSRQETNGQVSADQFRAGADYADTINDGKTWYVRDEAGFDRVNDISLYDIAAGGLGYDFIKEKNQTLNARLGLSYRYDRYTAPNSPSLSTAGVDTGLEYTLKIGKARLDDKISYLPAFQNFDNYVINHEFSFEVPITRSLWKLGTGVANTYYSKPAGGTDRLDTLYFTRLVLTWGRTQ